MRLPGKMVGEVLRHLLKKPATVHYPRERLAMPPGYRGKIVFCPQKCVGCKLCQRDCPAGALEIKKVGEKRFEAIFDLDRCIFCSQCVDSCNKKALETTNEFELAQIERKELKVVFAAPELAAPSQSGAATEQLALAGGQVDAPVIEKSKD